MRQPLRPPTVPPVPAACGHPPQRTVLIDTHCHLDDPQLLGRLDSVIAAARRAGVERFVVPAVDPGGWEAISLLARERADVFPAFGIHPLRADRADDRELARLAELAAEAVAIGEIGLDYLGDMPRPVQERALRAQLRIAVAAGRPVIIHCRKAFRDLIRILVEEEVARVGGVMHAFSGSPEVARECVGLGMLIAISGTVTYRNAVRPLEVVRQLPLDRLIIETDSPDMAPEPFRGGPNEPAFLLETARRLADLKGVPLEEVARVTTLNAQRLFRLP